MTRDEFALRTQLKNKRAKERRKLEEHFNSEILKRFQAGQDKDVIISDLRISRTLFNRVVWGEVVRSD